MLARWDLGAEADAGAAAEALARAALGRPDSPLLLADRALTVDAVAERVGFDDPKYFARVFKDLAGMSPSAYRRANVAD